MQFYDCFTAEVLFQIEDYGFCKKVRDAGYKVYAAPWARLGHYGTYLFEGQLIPAP